VTGRVVRDPVSGEVAVRTHFDPVMFPRLVWLIVSPTLGARNAGEDEVDESWVVLWTPDEGDVSDAAEG